ncbi:hypothetical protein [Rhodohalobacter sp. 8-1]|uniref:hypothetical protein n=1 Tax=Rhodohalobacter sp. 8-1 TaxID=3131972 RepID=UPI0030EC4554
MDINNISNKIGTQLNESTSSNGSNSASEISISKSNDPISDRVSIKNYGSNKGEELFAKIEMEKLNQSSFDNLKTMKAKISEYQAAKEVSSEAADQTEIGQLLNNPDVWGEIANKMLD